MAEYNVKFGMSASEESSSSNNIDEMDWGQYFVKEIQNETFTMYPPYEAVGSEYRGLYQEINDVDYNFLERELTIFYNKFSDPIVEEKRTFFLNYSRNEVQLPRNLDLNQKPEEDIDNSDSDSACKDDLQSVNLDSDSNEQQKPIKPETTFFDSTPDFPVTSSTCPVFDFSKMMQWYVHSSVSDLLYQMNWSKISDIPFLVECLLDLPIDENDWTYLKEKISEELMYIQYLACEKHILFWSTIIKLTRRNDLAKMLIQDASNQIILFFKGITPGDLMEEQLLIDEINLKGTGKVGADFFNDTFSKRYITNIVRLSRFLRKLVPHPNCLMPVKTLLESMLSCTTRSDDKSVVILVACVYQFMCKRDLFSTTNNKFFVPLQSKEKAILQVLSSLVFTMCSKKIKSVFPQSFIRFTKVLIFRIVITIHGRWAKMGINRKTFLEKRLAPNTVCDYQSSKTWNLNTGLIDEFFVWVGITYVRNIKRKQIEPSQPSSASLKTKQVKSQSSSECSDSDDEDESITPF